MAHSDDRKPDETSALGGEEPAADDVAGMHLADVFAEILARGFSFDSDDPVQKAAELRSALPEALRRPFDELFTDLAVYWGSLSADGVLASINEILKRSEIRAVVCERCGKVRFPKNPNARFCGDTCRVQANRDKNFF